MSLCEWCREGPAYRFLVPPYGVEEYELCASCMKILIESVAARPPVPTLENLRTPVEGPPGAEGPDVGHAESDSSDAAPAAS